MHSPGKSTGVGSHFFLQGIIPTQGLYLVLVHFWQNLDRLSYQGSPEPTSNIGDTGLIPGSGRSSREGSGNLFSILAWEISGSEKPVRLESMGLQKSWTKLGD